MSFHIAHGEGQHLMESLAGFAASSLLADGVSVMNGCVQWAPLKALEMISSSLQACSVRKSQLPVSHSPPTQLPPASSQRAPVSSARSQAPAWDRKVLPSASVQSGTVTHGIFYNSAFPAGATEFTSLNLDPSHSAFCLHTL